MTRAFNLCILTWTFGFGRRKSQGLSRNGSLVRFEQEMMLLWIPGEERWILILVCKAAVSQFSLPQLYANDTEDEEYQKR